MKTFLVSGGLGFIGSNICKLLIKKGYFVISVDNNSRSNRQNKKIKSKQIKYIKADITNKNSLNKIKFNIDGIFHLAFINGTRYFYERPDLVIKVGIEGMLNIIDFAKNKKVKEFYLASSSEVYQSPQFIPTDENEVMKVPDAYNPRYSYGGSKILSELIAINYGRLFLKKLVIFRPHNVYGPNMGGEHVIPEIIKKIKLSKKQKKKFIDIQGTGKETRTFNYIDDFIEGINVLMKKPKDFNTYNIGDKNEININKLIKKIMNLMKVDFKIKSGKLKKGSTLKRKPDIKKIIRLGYKPKTKLNDGLKKTINWYLAS